MKKEYTKPMVMIESFTLSDAVAGSCIIDVGFGESTVGGKACTYYDEWYDANVFTIQGGCETVWVDGDNKGCYHIPSESLGYFGS